MSYQPGKTLTNVWPNLDKILTGLRSLPFTPGILPGAIGGEACKDIRRHLYHKLMHELCPPASSCNIIFTHGDLRPDNIIEYSGFYPKYYEAAKSCVSPKRYAHWWLLNRVRETRVV
ncbi:hypothetical protein BDW59DRAFT_174160 [Aspergillus cavernicola]|uniref:Aminoglycoside phosphotransferase domain-containing protein n=1 Tax=Aspergillus cavernicola TaxID=176166 RepID=A0ABR4I1C7_9EURO